MAETVPHSASVFTIGRQINQTTESSAIVIRVKGNVKCVK